MEQGGWHGATDLVARRVTVGGRRPASNRCRPSARVAPRAPPTPGAASRFPGTPPRQTARRARGRSHAAGARPAQPPKQLVPVGVGRQPVERLDVRAHRDLPAEHSKPLGAVLQRSSAGAKGLEPHHQNRVALVGQPPGQVVEDPPAPDRASSDGGDWRRRPALPGGTRSRGARCGGGPRWRRYRTPVHGSRGARPAAGIPRGRCARG